MKELPKELLLTLNGKPKEKQSSRSGLYILQENSVNDSPYYLNTNKISAMWFVKTKMVWMIGDIGSVDLL